MKKVLVVEDNEDNMVLITSLLRKAGYQTIEAATGMEGYRQITQGGIDFVVMDIQLPDLDGTEVLAMLKKDGLAENLPIVCMTSYAMAGDRERFLAGGCDVYIEKPIDPETVVWQIEKAVQQCKKS